MKSKTVEVLVVCSASASVSLPRRASPWASGYDLCAALEQDLLLDPGQRALIPTGLRMAIPEGWELQVRPRSGLALRHGVTVLNAPGTIDSDYRGEVGVILINHGSESFTVVPGMRIAQGVLSQVEEIIWTEVDTLPSSERGQGGFGSTGQ